MATEEPFPSLEEEEGHLGVEVVVVDHLVVVEGRVGGADQEEEGEGAEGEQEHVVGLRET